MGLRHVATLTAYPEMGGCPRPDRCPRRREGRRRSAWPSSWRASWRGQKASPEVRQFSGGHANLTYLLTYPDAEFVLRRPPLGPVAPGSHDMAREYRVLSRLWQAFRPAPRALRAL